MKEKLLEYFLKYVKIDTMSKRVVRRCRLPKSSLI